VLRHVYLCLQVVAIVQIDESKRLELGPNEIRYSMYCTDMPVGGRSSRITVSSTDKGVGLAVRVVSLVPLPP
jgi:hypothetical protein